MSNLLREAIAAKLAAQSIEPNHAEVGRVSVDITLDERTETVTLSLRDDKLLCVATDGSLQGPYIEAAIAFLGGAEFERISQPPRVSLNPPASGAEQPIDTLATALDDLVVAIARVGFDQAHDSPSVDDGLQRLLKVAASPTPRGLSRWVNRLRDAIDNDEATKAARLLDGASRLARDLQENDRSAEAHQRVIAWTGGQRDSTPGLELLYDRTLVELAREWLGGVDNSGIERRYLLDLRSGEVFREERLRSERASVGPCPRQLVVGLAEIEPGPAPRRVRLLQYVVQPEVSATTWARIGQFAQRNFHEVAETYRASLKAFPGLAEPFALIAPQLLDRDCGMNPMDSDGRSLPISRTRMPELAAAFESMTAADDPLWIAGRLEHSEDGVEILPLSFASHLPQGGAVYQRLR